MANKFRTTGIALALGATALTGLVGCREDARSVAMPSKLSGARQENVDYIHTIYLNRHRINPQYLAHEEDKEYKEIFERCHRLGIPRGEECILNDKGIDAVHQLDIGKQLPTDFYLAR